MKRLLFILPLLTSLCSYAQDNDKLKSLAVALDTFQNKVPIEKVHLHLDKPYYSLGDTVWLKAYVVNENNELSGLSKIVYVNLVNDKDSVKTRLKLPLTQGLGWGAIVLGDTLLHAGNYHLLAYTNYMQNFDEDYFFDKSLEIGNALPPITADPNSKGAAIKSKVQPISKKNKFSAISVKFFPEGGNLVNGLPSVVAFKAVGADGLSQAVTGLIVDQDNKPVTTFRSDHAGMGTFVLQPGEHSSYTAVVKLPDSSEKKIILPQPLPQGYVLSVSQNQDKVFVRILTSNSLLKSGEVTFVAQENNQIKYSGKKELLDPNLVAVIPKSNFTEGIVQFTLFSPQFEPVAERLVFIRKNDDHLNIRIMPDKPNYASRGKVHLNLAVTGQDGKPVVGSFSLAVTDEGKVPYAEADETTIFSNLLLTSDLKGYIEQPNYYFTDMNANKDQQLDNLMLTQGWRRFAWHNILSNTLPALTYTAETGAGISGQALKRNKTPVPGIRISVLVNVGKGRLLDTVTNARGRFDFDHLNLKKGTKFNVSVEDAKNNNITIKVDSAITQPLTFANLPVGYTEDDNSFSTYLDNTHKRFDELKRYGLLNRGIMLKDVNIEEKVKPKTVREAALEFSSNLAGPGNADQVLTFIDLLGANEWKNLNGKLTNIQIKNSGFLNMRYNELMLVIVDGVPGRGMPMIQDVASIEVLRGGGQAALYGLRGSHGVVIISTKHAGVDYISYEEEHYVPGYNKPPGLKTYTFQGYDLRREFYSPDYDNPATNKQMADLRTTIYWAPNVITDKDGKASISFFNADGKGAYRVITEGLDGQGKLGRQVSKYMVQ